MRFYSIMKKKDSRVSYINYDVFLQMLSFEIGLLMKKTLVYINSLYVFSLTSVAIRGLGLSVYYKNKSAPHLPEPPNI